ncbi:MAG: hypothetical protein V1660_02750 [archaeon]
MRQDFYIWNAESRKISYMILGLILLTEILASYKSAWGGMAYASWIMVVATFIYTLPKQYDNYSKNFFTAILLLPALRMMQLLGPFDVVPKIWQTAIFYSVMLIASLIYIKSMDIHLLQYFNLKGRGYFPTLIAFAIASYLIWESYSKEPKMAFGVFPICILLFASIVQSIYFFVILQTNLENSQNGRTMMIIAFLSCFFILGKPLAVIITNFAFFFLLSFAFYRKKNLLMIIIPESLLNILQMIKF